MPTEYGAWSDEVEVLVGGDPSDPLAAVVGLTAVQTDAHEITLNWTAVAYAEGYEVHCTINGTAEGSEFSTDTLFIDGGADGPIVGGVNAGQLRAYKVRAWRGDSPF